jgi:signal transduction histidine kinase
VTESFTSDIAAIAGVNAVPVLLDIVCRSTGIGFAAVARVTESRWVACAVRDHAGFGLKPGDELQIETTICNEIRKTGQKIVIEDAAADPRFCLHPALAQYRFQSFISVPILRSDGSFFGTLCGFDAAPRPLASPDTIAMWETFAELIGFHLSALDQAAVIETSLLNERKTSALREQFIAVLGHDLRNPLTAILGGMEMLRKNPLNARASQWAEMVVGSAGRMAELIDVVVDFSRSRLGGGLIVEFNPCDSLEPALTQVVAGMRSSKPRREIFSRFSITETVQCDVSRVRQLAYNLLSNAMTYGDPDRPISVEAMTQDGWFLLAVANAGEPIPTPLLERIFEPFSRGAVQPIREGLGLGLYISHQIAMAHGGTLTVASTPEETRFTFRMPLRQPGN